MYKQQLSYFGINTKDWYVLYTSILGASAGKPLLFKLQEKAQKYFKIHGAKTLQVLLPTYITRAECYGSNPLSTYQHFFWSVPMRRVIIYMLLSSLLLVLKVRLVAGAQKLDRVVVLSKAWHVQHLNNLGPSFSSKNINVGGYNIQCSYPFYCHRIKWFQNYYLVTTDQVRLKFKRLSNTDVPKVENLDLNKIRHLGTYLYTKKLQIFEMVNKILTRQKWNSKPQVGEFQSKAF